jgi:L,D-peptidoglycan transpeptidase YkuD (ErfK/YbiS/YcfS/YnhG family)
VPLLHRLAALALTALAFGALQARVPLRVQQAADGTWVLKVHGRAYPCAVGRAGVAPGGEKREGDGRTPSGAFAMRALYYRPDKIQKALLPARWRPIALQPDDGWCDDPKDSRYNRPVKLPFTPSHEDLWREDDVYDLIVPLGYNDDPVVPGLGSAIFFHVAKPGHEPTAGCVAVSRAHFLEILTWTRPGDRMRIEAP